MTEAAGGIDPDFLSRASSIGCGLHRRTQILGLECSAAGAQVSIGPGFTAIGADKEVSVEFHDVVLPWVCESGNRLLEKEHVTKPRSVQKAISYQFEGSEDTSTLTAPQLTGEAKANGRVELGFPKRKSKGVNLYSKRGAETAYTFLARDTEAPYVDTRPLLVSGQPETRQPNPSSCSIAQSSEPIPTLVAHSFQL